MKTLIVMRHAKTEEGKANQKDFDRELISKGLKDADKMAHWIKKKLDPIDEIFASSAKRTKQTAEIVQEICGGELNLLDSLYHADPNGLLNQVHKAKGKTKTVLLVGHNPAVSNLVSYLSHEYAELKPSDIAVFELDNNVWDEKINIKSFKHHSEY